MKKFLEFFVKLLIVFVLLSGIALIILYISQEKLIFQPEKLNEHHQFSFKQKYEEEYFVMEDSVQLHSLLFKADSAKGLIYYLHGNAGSVNSFGTVSSIYTHLGYDILILDYRGFGKSQGKIQNEKQIYSDVQAVYNELKNRYGEDRITLLGYSIGSGMASMLAANNNPKQLILLAPYYNLPDLIQQIYPEVPKFVIKYKFRNNEFIPKTKCPITIFHGKNDKLIPCSSSERLYEICKPTDRLFLLENQTHEGIEENIIFQNKLTGILE